MWLKLVDKWGTPGAEVGRSLDGLQRVLLVMGRSMDHFCCTMKATAVTSRAELEPMPAPAGHSTAMQNTD